VKLYVAGPMRLRPAYNAPAFAAAAASLRQAGYEVITPIETDQRVDPTFDHYRHTATPEQIAQFQVESSLAMAGCDGVALLPGWEASKGTAAELDLARRWGMEVREAGEWVRP
jgi:hypothetical protein